MNQGLQASFGASVKQKIPLAMTYSWDCSLRPPSPEALVGEARDPMGGTLQNKLLPYSLR
jgi:hypothetical protein